LSRRHFLSNTAVGLGSVALAWLLSRDQVRGASSSARLPQLSHRKPSACARSSVAAEFSHIDTFDYKPELERFHGKTLERQGRETWDFSVKPGKVMKSAYEFRQHGQSGAWVSSLFPHLAGCVDELCFIHVDVRPE